MLLALIWSGYWVYRLAVVIPTALRVGRYEAHGPGYRRRITAWRNPIQYWFALLLWSLMLVFFVILFFAAGHALLHAKLSEL